MSGRSACGARYLLILFAFSTLLQKSGSTWCMYWIKGLLLFVVARPALTATRVRSIPSFSKAIRTYTGNISEMKQMAAHNFEDLLQVCLPLFRSIRLAVDARSYQCALPVFEGLFPEPHESNIRELIYWAATVHALAKLRIHTDATVASLDSGTKHLGKALRKFYEKTCTAFATQELDAERGKRIRQAMRNSSEHASTRSISRTFNVNTYKIHMLGHYARQIMLFGTTDSYSTSIVSFR